MQKLSIIKYDIDVKKDINYKNNLITSINNSNNEVISIYSDNLWDYSLLNSSNKTVSAKVIFNFNRKLSNGKYLSDYIHHQECLKDFCYIHLIEGYKTTTILEKYKDLFCFFDFLILNNIYLLNQVNINHLNQYIKKLSLNSLSYSSYKNKLLPLKNFFYNKRNILKYYINFDPFPQGTFKSTLTKKCKVSTIKQTPIIPDDTWKDIVNLCIKTIDNFNNQVCLDDLINHCISDYNYEKSNNRKRRELYFYKFFLYREDCLSEFNIKVSDVMTACGIIIQAFTGIRISELLTLKRNCVEQVNIEIDGNNELVNKIHGITFKYQKENHVDMTSGKNTFWYAPDIVVSAIDTIQRINQLSYFIFEAEGIQTEDKDLLFLSNFFSTRRRPIINNVGEKMKDFLLKGNIELDFKFSSHCFRRTLARFFARNLMGLQVEVLKEQFKHFSKDITLYYMNEDLKSESSFQEVIEGYLKKDNSTPYEPFNDKINKLIMTANNADELRVFIDGKHINIINDFLLNTNDYKSLSPIQSLTCEGTIILPDLHLHYWEEMYIMYKELIDVEPNSIWYKREMNMVEDVINTLKKGNAYIVKGAKK